MKYNKKPMEILIFIYALLHMGFDNENFIFVIYMQTDFGQ